MSSTLILFHDGRSGVGRRPLMDSYGRVIRKVRVSVTDRCNFRCVYCMPSTPLWMPKDRILTFEEIARMVRVLTEIGVSKVRLTGGEPLVRNGVEDLVMELSSIPGVKQLAMTTNGFLLAEKASALKEAGLMSVTVSLPSLDRKRFKEITGVDGLERVLRGVDAALDEGFDPVKVNATIVRGLNDDEIVALAEYGAEKGLFVRFIEFMPFDGRGLWKPEFLVPWKEMLSKVKERFEVEPLPREPGSTSLNYAFKGGGGVGFIASMTAPFCDDCERIRLTADGRLVPCMFGKLEFDVKPLLRGGAGDEELIRFIRSAVKRKERGIKYLLEKGRIPRHVRPMYTLGG